MKDIKNPLPAPTNVQKFRAQSKGFDADYIPGQDDGEVQEFKLREQDDTTEKDLIDLQVFEGSDEQRELLAKGIY